MKKHIIFLGPPGAGKGTHASALQSEYRLLHLSTGDMLREAITSASELGNKASAFMDAGQLVPDELVIDMLLERMASLEQGGWILDGFPRTLPQAEALDARLQEQQVSIDQVFCFEVDEEKLVERLSSRQVCKGCGAVYNTQSKPPKTLGVCDDCGKKELYVRPDDEADAVRKRFEVYEAQTAPLIDYYKRAGLLCRIDASRGIEEIRAELKRSFEG
ncbi:MAG: adenylate kinase [Planctomycetota bacterium]|nr:MAG: adenylate kinase [Planctomycetota bacterium]